MSSNDVWYEGETSSRDDGWIHRLIRHERDARMVCLEDSSFWGDWGQRHSQKMETTARRLLEDSDQSSFWAAIIARFMLRRMPFDGWAITQSELRWLVAQLAVYRGLHDQ